MRILRAEPLKTPRTDAWLAPANAITGSRVDRSEGAHVALLAIDPRSAGIGRLAAVTT